LLIMGEVVTLHSELSPFLLTNNEQPQLVTPLSASLHSDLQNTWRAELADVIAS